MGDERDNIAVSQRVMGKFGFLKAMRFSTLFHLRTSITSDEFWVTSSLF